MCIYIYIYVARCFRRKNNPDGRFTQPPACGPTVGKARSVQDPKYFAVPCSILCSKVFRTWTASCLASLTLPIPSLPALDSQLHPNTDRDAVAVMTNCADVDEHACIVPKPVVPNVAVVCGFVGPTWYIQNYTHPTRGCQEIATKP